MRASYDAQVRVLQVLNGQTVEVSASLIRGPDAAVHLGTHDGHDIVGFLVVGGSAFLPLGKRGYDPDTDTLTIGTATDDPDLVTENGDFIGYWEVDKLDAKGFRDSIGVALRNASVHLAPVLASFPESSGF